MGLLHDNVFDAALDVVSACTEAEVQNAASLALVDAVVLDAGNFGSNADYTSGGREVECLQSSTNDMKAINVDAAGSATKVVLKTSIASAMTVMVEAGITGAPVTLGASDQVNLGTFKAILQDP